MVGRLLHGEKTSGVLVLALSGAVIALAANGPGPVSLGRNAAMRELDKQL
jgi:hypothetical protein